MYHTTHHSLACCFLASLLCLTSCTTGDRAIDTMNGASFGAVFGSALGSIVGGRRGHDVGTMVGLIAGGAIGHAASSASTDKSQRAQKSYDTYEQPRMSRKSHETYHTDYEPRQSASANSPLTLRNLRFIGQNGQSTEAIHRGETCQLVFELANRSGRNVRDITPYIDEMEGNEHLFISPSTRIESLSVGDAIRYTATIRADKRLKEGQAQLRIAVSCDEGDFIPLYNFTIRTLKK